MKSLTVGSTFTGIGGADLGFEWAGFDIKWQCEFDSWKQQVLRAHWPDVELFDDICTMQDPAPVDVMIGGFPCQDLSVAGRRKGFSGERSVLAFEFLRVAESLQPRWIVLENVPGLLSSSGGRDFARLIDEVVGCG
jgi:DNA (cytosine-5)-methyltransferase 1